MLHPLFISHMRDMPFGRKSFHVSVRVALHEALGLFLTCSLESVCLLCSVSSVPSIFLVTNNSSKIRCFTVHNNVLQKCSQKSCHLYFYSIKDKEIRLETQYLAISSISFFSVDESFIWRYRMCTPTYIIDRCYYWSARAAHAK